jgi:hypothetical protein
MRLWLCMESLQCVPEKSKFKIYPIEQCNTSGWVIVSGKCYDQDAITDFETEKECQANPICKAYREQYPPYEEPEPKPKPIDDPCAGWEARIPEDKDCDGEIDPEFGPFKPEPVLPVEPVIQPEPEPQPVDDIPMLPEEEYIVDEGDLDESEEEEEQDESTDEEEEEPEEGSTEGEGSDDDSGETSE